VVVFARVRVVVVVRSVDVGRMEEEAGVVVALARKKRSKCQANRTATHCQALKRD
jgi:hypothetical protein